MYQWNAIVVSHFIARCAIMRMRMREDPDISQNGYGMNMGVGTGGGGMLLLFGERKESN